LLTPVTLSSVRYWSRGHSLCRKLSKRDCYGALLGSWYC